MEGGGGREDEGCHVDRDLGSKWDCPSFPDTQEVFGSREQLGKKKKRETDTEKQRERRMDRRTAAEERWEELWRGFCMAPMLCHPCSLPPTSRMQLVFKVLPRGRGGGEANFVRKSEFSTRGEGFSLLKKSQRGN